MAPNVVNRIGRTVLLPFALCAIVGLSIGSQSAWSADPLETGFHHPPASARPQTWWHWLNGNVTRAGIKADLEAMSRIGLGGAEIFNVDQSIPAGPVRFMSPQWLDMVQYAASECKRLGLQLCIHNCAGWSSSGGPWNTPEHAMQFLTTSEIDLKGPSHFQGALPQPPSRLATYREIAVLAFRTPAADVVKMRSAAPAAAGRALASDRSGLLVASPDDIYSVDSSPSVSGTWLERDNPTPLRARTLQLVLGPGRADAAGELQVSDDGRMFRTVRAFTVPREGRRSPGFRLNFDPVTARFWRIYFPNKVRVEKWDLTPQLRISDIQGKAAFVRADRPQEMNEAGSPDAVIARDTIVNLSARMQPDGKLTWDVPEGNWTVLRVGYTPTGSTNEPAPPEGRGPEVDKLSREAVDAHWNGSLGPVLKRLGPLAGPALNDVLVDSYEVGSQNWSPRFREDFRARRGYDPVPWLPVTTGRVIESPQASERFLWDLRRTVADLYAENYYGRLAELAHQNRLLFSAEPYGNGSFEDFQSGGRADIPMGEFWAGDGAAAETCKLAASIAHIYGKKVAGAESFTSVPQHARWTNSPYSLKALGDRIYCSGINRFIFHRYAMQPWTDKAPGMTMGPWGIHFERTETWWNQAAAWMQYLTRCQYLLQQGLFVADVVSFCGEDGPNTLLPPAGLPAGYDYDGCNAEVLLNRMTVKNGRLTLPGGISYRVLTLPDGDTMTPAMVGHLRDLVRAGAIVVGPKPSRSPSLEGYPGCDETVRTVAQELWGDCDGKDVTEHNYGKGRIYWGKPLSAVLADLAIEPDFEGPGVPPSQVHYIHRSVDGTEIYFVANSGAHDLDLAASFRVAGRQPELWHPGSGTTERCAVWRRAGDRTVIPLRLPPSGSVFVVFRDTAPADHLVSVHRQGPAPIAPRAPDLTIVKALYGVLSEPDLVDVTAQVQRSVDQGVNHITAGNDLAGDPAPNEVKELRVEFLLNGVRQSRTVAEGQSTDIPPGAKITRARYGLLPDNENAPTQILDITARLAALVKNGELHAVAGNELAGQDPASLIPKQLSVEYRLNGVDKKVMLAENQPLDLPGDLQGPDQPPTFEVRESLAGAVSLVAWKPGQFTLVRASGQNTRLKARPLPAAFTIAGPWRVTFPPRLGAPPEAVFDKLVSWPDRPETGIKYFSGTATYRTTFEALPGLFAPGRRFALDLGDVQVIAEPSLNDRPLGTLWKPPFRVDVTNLIRKGENTLEVKVTNLWPNRLIGDEQFPDDCTYTPGGSIAEWPEWLLKGTPRPEPRRIAFTTWKHWKKGDSLLPSGLIGPVTIETGEELALPPG